MKFYEQTLYKPTILRPLNRRLKRWPIGLIVLSLFAGLIIPSGPAFSARDCIKDVRIEPRTMIDFDSSPQPTSYFIRLRSRGSKDCPFIIHFSTGASGSLNRALVRNSTQIRYGLFASPCTPATPDCTNPQLQDSGTSGAILRGTLTKKDDLRIPFYPVFPLEAINVLTTQNPLKGFGLYEDTINLSALESDDGGATYAVTAVSTFSLRKTIPKFTIVSIVDTGAPYVDPPVKTKTIEFSNLTAGSSSSFDLVALYNAGFQLSLESQNGSRLKSMIGNLTIPYELRINGAVRALPPASPQIVLSGSGTSPPPGSGTRAAIQVSFPSTSFSQALGGTYEDILYVTISSTE